jgi:hypothetical protein
MKEACADARHPCYGSACFALVEESRLFQSEGCIPSVARCGSYWAQAAQIYFYVNEDEVNRC